MIPNEQDAIFELLNRFNIIIDLGFKQCKLDDEDGIPHVVFSPGSPNEGYKPKEILMMSEQEFNCLVNDHVN